MIKSASYPKVTIWYNLKKHRLICYIHTCFITAILDLTVFGFRNLDTIVNLYSFCFFITPVITASAIRSITSANRLSGFCVIWTL